MEIIGKIITVLEARGGISKTSGNSWKIQEYVLETTEQYPRRMCFNVFGEDKINQFNIQVGDNLKVSFDINAREYQGRWYNDIRAWAVERVSNDAPVPAADPFPTEPAPAAADPFAAASDSTDDLPF